jgi:hypothetical protein
MVCLSSEKTKSPHVDNLAGQFDIAIGKQHEQQFLRVFPSRSDRYPPANRATLFSRVDYPE